MAKNKKTLSRTCMSDTNNVFYDDININYCNYKLRQVRGFCTDKSNPEIFDEVNTYGDVIDSDIHHLFYGLYTYGHLGGLWTGNLMHDNEW